MASVTVNYRRQNASSRQPTPSTFRSEDCSMRRKKDSATQLMILQTEFFCGKVEIYDKRGEIRCPMPTRSIRNRGPVWTLEGIHPKKLPPLD